MIDKFAYKYSFLSNFYMIYVHYEGLTYVNAEAAFQASKCAEVSERKVFANCSTDKAVQKGKELMPFPEWEEAQLDFMESILTAKFEQNPTLKKMLAETGNRILINGNNKQETFWGIDLYSWMGDNHLGKIIMKIREKEIKK